MSGPPKGAYTSMFGSQNITPALTWVSEWVGPFPVGSTYTILTLPVVHNTYIDPRLAGITQTTLTRSYFELLSFASDTMMQSFVGWNLLDCYVDAGILMGATAYNCCFGYLGFSSTQMSTVQFGLIPAEGCVIGSGCLSLCGLMFQGPDNGLFINSPGEDVLQAAVENHHASFGLGIYDCDSPIVLGPGTTFYNESSIYGTGITTCVVNLQQGAAMYDSNAYTGARPYCTASAAPSDIIINNQTSLPAMDPSTYELTGSIPLTFANVFKTVASGGFEGIVFDPRSPGTRIEYAHP